MNRDSPRALSAREVDALGAIGFALAAAAAVVAIANTSSDRRFFLAAVAAATVATLIALGAYAWRHDPASRFGRLLVVAPLVAFLTTFGASDHAILYSIGRVSGWIFELLLIYLFCAYPSGRLSGRTERLIVGVAAIEVAVLWLPTALIVEQFPTPWSMCISGCPDNAFQITTAEPGFVDSVVRPARELITLIVWAATALVLGARLLAATPVRRRGLVAVVSVLMFRLAALAGFLIARRAGANDATLEVFSVFVLLSVPAAVAGFVVGQVRLQLHRAKTLETMAFAGDAPTLSELRNRLADALGDPTLELHYAAGGTNGDWRDSSGDAVPAPNGAVDPRVLEILASGKPIGAIVCQHALDEHRTLLDSVAGWVRAAIEREYLTTALSASLRDVEASRRRISAAAVTERHRLERDLHDGAQQQLVSLRIQLELAAEESERDPDAVRARLRELRRGVDIVIEQVRDLARGIYPSLLGDAGLGQALRAVAVRAMIPTTVQADDRRFPPEVENSVYFCCLEAMQNVAKHADATSAWIEISTIGDRLRFVVRDDGRGFDALTRSRSGSGLTNMRDRLAAIGGMLTVESAPGRGTRIIGEVPAAPIA